MSKRHRLYTALLALLFLLLSFGCNRLSAETPALTASPVSTAVPAIAPTAVPDSTTTPIPTATPVSAPAPTATPDLMLGTCFVLIGSDPSERTISYTSRERDITDVRAGSLDVSEEEWTPLAVQTDYDRKAKTCFYTAALTDLPENARWGYRITAPDGRWSGGCFETGAENGGFSFLFAGDTHTSDEIGRIGRSWRESLENTLHIYPDVAFLLSAGDATDQEDVEAEYEQFCVQPQMRDLTFSPNIGNHNSACRLYSRHFPTPNQGKETRDYYFFWQDALIVSVNSNNTDYGAHIDFLNAALAAYEGTRGEKPNYFIVTLHRTMFSGGEYASSGKTNTLERALAPAFSALDVDLVLMGHDHAFSRSVPMAGTAPALSAEKAGSPYQKKPGETVYITVGPASDCKYYDLLPERPAHVAASLQTEQPTMTRVTVGDGRIIAETYVTESIYLVDTVTIQK